MNKKIYIEAKLDERIENPENTEKIDAEIEEKLKVKKATYIQDMSGFSRLVIKYGIIHYLTMIHKMRKTVIPIIMKNNGEIIKTEADNVYATFDNVDDAINSAKEAILKFEAMNVILTDENDIYVSIGIGYGELLDLGDDFYGNEVNLASKLGEDIAEKNEILITQSAFNNSSLKDDCEKITASISGITLEYYKINK